jgi:hypothetical protein
MAPGPVRWPWIASSVASETFPTGVRFRGWMSEAEGFLCSRLPASLTWPARPGSARLARPRLSGTIPRSQAVCRLTRSAARPVVPTSTSDRLRRVSHPGIRVIAVPISRLPLQSARSCTRRGRALRLPAPESDRLRCGSSPGVGREGSWQRIDGVSRLLPYSDLLALTSSSRRGEGGSDRGSWKRLRILPTGHVDARVEPDIETGAVLIGPCVVP